MIDLEATREGLAWNSRQKAWKAMSHNRYKASSKYRNLLAQVFHLKEMTACRQGCTSSAQ